MADGTYDVFGVRYGTLRTSRSEFFASYSIYDAADSALTMDYYFWVLRSSEGTVLVDCGFDEQVAIRRGRTPLADPRTELAALDIDPAEISHLVISHCHYDHIGNLAMFPHARLIIHPAELEFWSGQTRAGALPSASVESREIAELARAAASGRVMRPTDAGAYLPGITYIDLAGHTPGHLGVVVESPSRTVVLAADAAHSYEELERDMPFHIYTDIVGMYHSLELLRRWATRANTVVVPGHDPDVMRRFPVGPSPNIVRLG